MHVERDQGTHSTSTVLRSSQRGGGMMKTPITLPVWDDRRVQLMLACQGRRDQGAAYGLQVDHSWPSRDGRHTCCRRWGDSCAPCPEAARRTASSQPWLPVLSGWVRAQGGGTVRCAHGAPDDGTVGFAAEGRIEPAAPQHPDRPDEVDGIRRGVDRSAGDRRLRRPRRCPPHGGQR